MHSSAAATCYNWILLFWAFTKDDLYSLGIVRDDIFRNKVFHGSFLAFTAIWLTLAPLGFMDKWVSTVDAIKHTTYYSMSMVIRSVVFVDVELLKLNPFSF